MLRQAIIPTASQQGVSEPKAASTASGWGWARLLQRVFGLDMATCPVCQKNAPGEPVGLARTVSDPEMGHSWRLTGVRGYPPTGGH